MSSLTPATIPLGLSLLTSTTILFGNVGLSLCGPLPILKGTLGNITLSPKQRVRLWKLFFDRAGILIVSGTLLTTTLSLASAYLTTSLKIRNLALTTATSAISIIPYTLVFIQPTNSELGALDSAVGEISGERVDELIRRWDVLHKIRFLAYGLSAGSALLGLIREVGGRF